MSGLIRAAVSASAPGRASSPSPLPQSETDALFVEAIKMIEYDTMIHSHDSLKGYYWYMLAQFPMPAYLCLLSGLRTRTTGELCERAWDAIIEHHEARRLMSHLRTPMHLAYAPLFVKAWDARETAEAQLGRTLAPPKLITLLRQYVARMPKRERTKSPASAPSPPVAVAPVPSTTSEEYVPERPPALTQATSTADIPATVPLYPGPDIYPGLSAINMPRQFQGNFQQVNFGGEMDWNYLVNEYHNFMTPAVAPPHFMSVSAAHDPNTGNLW
jgi:hypothetical protein